MLRDIPNFTASSITMRKHFYISGLGSNHLVYEHLVDFDELRIMIQWEEPIRDESLESYCGRIIDSYEIRQEDIVIGYSFGGVIAQQIAGLLAMDEVILISSFRTKHDLKTFLDRALKLKLHRLLLELNLFLISELVVNFLHCGSAQTKTLMKEMIRKSNAQLISWSLDRIFELELPILGPKTKICNIIGDSDELVKTWENNSTYVIHNGNHLMVYDCAPQLSAVLDRILDNSVVRLFP